MYSEDSYNRRINTSSTGSANGSANGANGGSGAASNGNGLPAGLSTAVSAASSVGGGAGGGGGGQDFSLHDEKNCLATPFFYFSRAHHSKFITGRTAKAIVPSLGDANYLLAP